MVRHAETKEGTSALLSLIAEAIRKLDTSVNVWEEAIRLAKDELNTLTRTAVLSADVAGLHTAGYQVRAQELVIRIEILEELLGQIAIAGNLQQSQIEE